MSRQIPRRVRRSLTAATLAGAVTLSIPVPAHATTTDVGCSTTAGADLQAAVIAAAAGDTLRLTDYCVYTLTTAQNVLFPLDGLLIDKQLTITTVSGGNTATIRRDPGISTDLRVIEVATGGNLTLSHVTVTNGLLSDTTTTLAGAGILVSTGGTLTADNILVQKNNSGSNSGQGGGIAASTNSVVTVTDSVIKNNRASDLGGGVLAGRAQVTLTRVTMTLNRAGRGGGVAKTGSSPSILTLTDSTLKNNTATSTTYATLSNVGGGGIALVSSGSTSISGTTIADNTSLGALGGGGVYFETSVNSSSLTDSVVTGNTATYSAGTPVGGGISAQGGTLNVSGTTVSANRVTGENGLGGGIYTGPGATTNISSSTTASSITKNTTLGDESKGAGIYNDGVLSVDSASITDNIAKGSNAKTGGIYNTNVGGGPGLVTLTNATIEDNTSDAAPAPGGVYTDVAIAPTGGSITGNSPTNCLFSPATVTGCVN